MGSPRRLIIKAGSWTNEVEHSKSVEGIRDCPAHAVEALSTPAEVLAAAL